MDSYKSAFLLSAVGDSIGSKWRSQNNGDERKREIDLFTISPKVWPVSAGVILHIATAKALKTHAGKSKEELFDEMTRNYVGSVDMTRSRHNDPTFVQETKHLRPGRVMGWHIPFNVKGSGYGASNRAMCLGLLYPRPEQIDDLVAVATESGRITHNHPVGFTGAVCVALFTSYIIQSKPITQWGRDMLKSLDKIKFYCKKTIRNFDEYRHHWLYFETKWEMYLKERAIDEDGKDEPKFPDNYLEDEKLRNQIYSKWSSDGQIARHGHDAPMVAYDALLMAQLRKSSTIWQNLIVYAMHHDGETAATGGIAGFWYGLMYGMEGVPPNHYQDVEYRYELEEISKDLYEIAN